MKEDLRIDLSGQRTCILTQTEPPYERTKGRTGEDLTERQFGELTPLYRVKSDQHGNARWVCRCSCGNLHTATALHLKRGTTKSCGCLRRNMFRGMDLTGQKFGRLTVLYPVKKDHKRSRGSVIWRCRCDCGNEKDVEAFSLRNGEVSSCGCLLQESKEKIHTRLHFMESTCLEFVKSNTKNRKNNTSGFRGVTKDNDKYYVRVGFQGTRYYLGSFNTYEEAVQARLEAEEVLNNGFIDAHQRWSERAEADPEWAENNPFFYVVRRVGKEFYIDTNVVEV